MWTAENSQQKIAVSWMSQQCQWVPEQSFPQFPRQDAMEHGLGTACKSSVWGTQTPADSFLQFRWESRHCKQIMALMQKGPEVGGLARPDI